MTPEAHRHTARALLTAARWSVLRAKDELEHAAGRDLTWVDAQTVENLLSQLVAELAPEGERRVFVCREVDDAA